MANPTTYQQRHLKSLTGLRFFAALSVFVAHVGVHWPAYRLGDLPFGAAGVSFFYVLSGFILTYVYGEKVQRNDRESADGAEESFSFKQFYLRRFARIWPLHIVTLLLSLFFVMGTQAFFNRPNAIGKLLVNGLLVQSWIPNYDWIYSLNGPSWSLAVEAFFYVVFPFLLLGGPRRFVGKFIAIAIATAIALCVLHLMIPNLDPRIQLNAIFHANPLMRLFEFAMGVGCGFLFLNRQPRMDSTSSMKGDSIIELAALASLIAFFLVANWIGLYSAKMLDHLPIVLIYWFRFCGAAPVFAVVVFVFARRNGLFSKVLSSRLLVYLGEISYSFYMVHMGVILILKRMEWLDGPYVEIGVVTSSFLISILLSSVLYHLIELPFRRLIVGERGGESRNIFALWTRSIKDWTRTVWFIPFVLFAIGSCWFIASYRFDERSSDRISFIVDTTDAELKGVKFEDDAVLLGVTASPLEDGDLVIEMAWQLSSKRREERFIKLLDADLNVVGRGGANRKLFNSVVEDAKVIDRVRIKAKQLANVEIIAVGFFDQQRKSAKVDRGPRSARDRQLHIWTRR